MNEDKLVWLFGLEKFFNYINDNEKKRFIRNIINLKYSTVDSKPWPLKELISYDYLSCQAQGREDRLNFYTNICSHDTLLTNELIGVMYSIWPADTLIKKLYEIGNVTDESTLTTVFSKSQVLGKIWMAEILSKFKLNFSNILLIGGWLSHHDLFLKDIIYNQMYSIDPDASVNNLAKIMNPSIIIENKNINECIDDQGNFMLQDQLIEFDLIINTSAEHMDNTWFNKLKSGTRVLIQSNSSDVDQGHINPSINLPDFIKKYPLSESLFRGDMTFPKYKRFMSYGIK
jgi:hypothetical protein